VPPRWTRLTSGSRPITEACAETGAVALAGAPVPGPGGEVFIAVLAVGANGATVAYRKMWLVTETGPQAGVVSSATFKIMV
jgi:hypothetical protein